MGEPIETYVDRVIKLLGAEFDWDDTTAEAFWAALLSANDGRRLERFEFICDPPIAARWRVKHNTQRLTEALP